MCYYQILNPPFASTNPVSGYPFLSGKNIVFIHSLIFGQLCFHDLSPARLSYIVEWRAVKSLM